MPKSPIAAIASSAAAGYSALLVDLVGIDVLLEHFAHLYEVIVTDLPVFRRLRRERMHEVPAEAALEDLGRETDVLPLCLAGVLRQCHCDVPCPGIHCASPRGFNRRISRQNDEGVYRDKCARPGRRGKGHAQSSAPRRRTDPHPNPPPGPHPGPLPLSWERECRPSPGLRPPLSRRRERGSESGAFKDRSDALSEAECTSSPHPASRSAAPSR